MAWNIKGNAVVSRLMSALRLAVTGTAGAGYVSSPEQSSSPSAPAAGSRNMFIDGAGVPRVMDSEGGISYAAPVVELNYISSPNSAEGWEQGGTGLTLSTSTTASELPREHLIPSGLKLVGTNDTEGSGDYIYKTFTLDDADLNKMLKIRWDQALIDEYVAGTFEVYIAAAATPGTALITPEVTVIPSAAGTFSTQWASTDVAELALVIRATGNIGVGVGICASNIIVGPGTFVSGAAVGPWTKYFDNTTASSFVSNYTALSGTSGHWKRTGSCLDLSVRLRQSGNTGASAIQIKLPTGMTYDTSVAPAVIVESYAAYLVEATQAITPASVKWNSSANAFEIFVSGGAAARTMADGATADQYYVKVIGIPIVGLSSSVMLASEATKSPAKAGFVQAYAGSVEPSGWKFCDGSAVSRTTYAQLFANIGTTFGTGDGSTTFNLPDMRGIFLKGAGTTNRAAGVDANGAAYSGTLGTYLQDKMQGHLHDTGLRGYITSSSVISGSGGTDPTAANATSYTSKTYNTAAPKTDNINGTPRTGSTTEPQSLGVNFIIKLFDDNPASVAGFNIATTSSPVGLAKAGAIPGGTSGLAVPTGYVGEEINGTQIGQDPMTSGAFYTLATIKLNKGTYIVHGTACSLSTAASALTAQIRTTETDTSGSEYPGIGRCHAAASSYALVQCINIITIPANNTTLYLRAIALQSGTAAADANRQWLRAIRIA